MSLNHTGEYVAQALPLRDQRAEVRPGSCPHCGYEPLSWSVSVLTDAGVSDGRLRMHDVYAAFVLGCESCSATFRTVRADSEDGMAMIAKMEVRL